MKQILLLLLVIIISGNQAAAQKKRIKPAYPILFVHGYAGSDSAWLDKDYNWAKLFESYGWRNGGSIDICLESVTNALHDAASRDVSLIHSGRIRGAGDFYFINFHVKNNGNLYPSLTYKFHSKPDKPRNNETKTLYFHSSNKGEKKDITWGDILKIFTPESSPNQREFVRVISRDWNKIRVNRDILNMGKIEINHDSKRVDAKNLTNLSNQASIVKGGKGVKMAIEKIKKLTHASKVMIIAHSMGGLNAREYIQGNEYERDVAKLVTISTPHQGCNLSDFGAMLRHARYDAHSDAVRDMRFSNQFKYSRTPSEKDNGPYLFGRQRVSESDFEWKVNIPFYSNDFNADGKVDSKKIKGINNLSWPPSVEMHCIITQYNDYLQYFPNLLVSSIANILPPTDLVVRKERQLPPKRIFANQANLEVTNIEETPISLIDNPEFPHMISRKRLSGCIVGVDAPEQRTHAFKISPTANDDILYSEPSTYNFNSSWRKIKSNLSQTADMDSDWFKFTARQTRQLHLSVDQLSEFKNWQIRVESENGTLLYEKNQHSGTPGMLLDVKKGKKYYINFKTKPTKNSWQNPFEFSLAYKERNPATEPYLPLIALVVGSSGSMGQSDPRDIRKKAAKAILHLLEDNTAVFLVDFDNKARWINPNQWKNYSISNLEKVISTIDSKGGTKIGKGLNRMRHILENHQSNISNGAVLLLSDGKSDYQNEAEWFANQHIPIYTVSYKGIGNGQLLSSIASKTGGQYIKAYDESDVLAAFEDFHYQLKGYSPIMKLTERITQDQIITTTFESEPNASEMVATTSWQGSKIAVRLISPHGREYIESGQNAEWNIRNNYIATRIRNPAPGKWKAELKGVQIPSGGEPFTFYVNEDTPNKIKLNIEKSPTGNILLMLNQNKSQVKLKKVNPQVDVTTPSRKSFNISSNFNNNRIEYFPANGKGSYRFRIRFRAIASNGQPIQRHFERSVFIGDSTLTNAARIQQVTGNYLRSPLGKNSGNQVGIHCTIYDQTDSTHTQAKAKGIVTYVAPNWCNIEIQRYLGGSFQVSVGDIIRLDLNQWESDRLP